AHYRAQRGHHQVRRLAHRPRAGGRHQRRPPALRGHARAAGEAQGHEPHGPVSGREGGGVKRCLFSAKKRHSAKKMGSPFPYRQIVMMAACQSAITLCL
nr:hypothetical protein [Tanacetum cinerariifolium]